MATREPSFISKYQRAFDHVMDRIMLCSALWRWIRRSGSCVSAISSVMGWSCGQRLLSCVLSADTVIGLWCLSCDSHQLLSHTQLCLYVGVFSTDWSKSESTADHQGMSADSYSYKHTCTSALWFFSSRLVRKVFVFFFHSLCLFSWNNHFRHSNEFVWRYVSIACGHAHKLFNLKNSHQHVCNEVTDKISVTSTALPCLSVFLSVASTALPYWSDTCFYLLLLQFFHVDQTNVFIYRFNFLACWSECSGLSMSSRQYHLLFCHNVILTLFITGNKDLYHW